MWPCVRSEEHTSELQSHLNLVCRLLLEKKTHTYTHTHTHTHTHTYIHCQSTVTHTHTHTRTHTHTHTHTTHTHTHTHTHTLFFNHAPTPEIISLPLHAPLPI